jgi:hypothetical protein
VGREGCVGRVPPEHLASCAVENERPFCAALRERERARDSRLPEPGRSERNVCEDLVLFEYERAEGVTHTVWGADRPALEEACRSISPETFRQLDAQVANAR